MCFIKQQNLTFYLKFSVSLLSHSPLNDTNISKNGLIILPIISLFCILGHFMEVSLKRSIDINRPRNVVHVVACFHIEVYE